MTAGSPAPGRVNRTDPARRCAALAVGLLLLLGSTVACSNTAPPAAAPPAAAPATSAAATSVADTSVAATSAAATASAAPAASAAAVTATAVVIKNFLFAPESLTVAAGATVMVDNQDGANHTITADDGSFDTGNIAGNARGMFTAPTKPGTYPYKCAIHPFMTGTLIVT